MAHRVKTCRSMNERKTCSWLCVLVATKNKVNTRRIGTEAKTSIFIIQLHIFTLALRKWRCHWLLGEVCRSSAVVLSGLASVEQNTFQTVQPWAFWARRYREIICQLRELRKLLRKLLQEGLSQPTTGTHDVPPDPIIVWRRECPSHSLPRWLTCKCHLPRPYLLRPKKVSSYATDFTLDSIRWTLATICLIKPRCWCTTRPLFSSIFS